jgi:hypothetical protein
MYSWSAVKDFSSISVLGEESIFKNRFAMSERFDCGHLSGGSDVCYHRYQYFFMDDL